MSDTIAVPRDRIKHLHISSVIPLCVSLNAYKESVISEYNEQVVINALAKELAVKLVEYKKFALITEYPDTEACFRRIHVDLCIIVPEGPANE